MSARRPDSDAVPAPRPALEPEWLAIWAAGESLVSRLQRRVETDAGANAPLGDEDADKLQPWARAYSDGDVPALLRRLSWDAVSPESAAAALSDDPVVAPTPAESELLARYLEACAQPSSPAGEQIPFEELWWPWVHAALDTDVENVLAGAGLAVEARGALRDALLVRMAQTGELAAWEMFRQVRRAAGEAAGLYDAFCAELRASGCRSLFAAFPVLLRQLTSLALDGRRAAIELGRRLEDDREKVQRVLGDGSELGQVTEISVLDSDPHHGGRRVLRLRFACGMAVVYKPRDLTIEAGVAALAAWLAERGLVSAPRAARTLARQGYGWQEWVGAEELADEDEARVYYHRAGGWLAIAHLLRARDLHAENVVATRRGPVIVDAEMFLQPEELRLGAAEGPAPARSCLATGLLADPLRRGAAWRPGMGGFEAPVKQKLGDGARRWVNVGGDDMTLESAEVWATPRANAVRLRGEALRPADFAAEIGDGFAATCELFERERASLLADGGPLGALAAGAVRVLFRASQQYADTLSLLIQPRHQRDSRAAGFLLERLLQPFAASPSRPLLWPLAADERRALERLDLPRFTIGASSRTLIAESGERIEGVAARSGLEAVRADISRLDSAEIGRQVSILRQALERTAENVSPLPVEAGFRAEAVRIGELLLRELHVEGALPAPSTPARTGDAGASERSVARLLRRAIGARPVGSATSGEAVVPGELAQSLAVGATGVVLFLSGLYAATRDPKWRIPVDDLSPYPAWAGGRRSDESRMPPATLGGFTGAGGSIWASVWISKLLQDSCWLDLAEATAQGIRGEEIDADQALDVHDGVAGAILGLLTLWEERRQPWILERALACGERLLAARAEDGGWRDGSGLPRLGFAHGASGIGRALAALGRATGEDRWLEAARSAFASEAAEFDAARGDWPAALWRDPASGELRRTWMTAWCRGAAGGALARGLAAPHGASAASETELAAAVEAVRVARPAPVEDLCCGNLGRAAVLGDIADRRGRPQLAEEARRLARSAWQRAIGRGAWQLGARGDTPAGEWSLLKGLCGIGWQLLALEDGARLPSLLALESPAELNSRLLGRETMTTATIAGPTAVTELPGLRLPRLEPPVAEAFGKMTFPVYRHLLALRPTSRHPEQGDSRPVQPLAIAAYLGEQPAGLILLEMPLGDTRPPEILSLFVAPEVRQRGIARALVSAAEDEIRRRGFPELDAVYTTGRPGAAIAEHLLQNRGWEVPETRTVLVQIVPRDFLESSLLEPERTAALDPGFEYFAWKDLDPAERQALIDSDARQPWVTKGLWAWKYDTEGFDHATSLGVRYGGQIVGWVLSQRIDAGTVRYLASFLRKDLSRRSRILPLYRESLTRGMEDGVELATWVTPMLYPSMIRFIQKWMAPHARLVAETRGCKLRFT